MTEAFFRYWQITLLCGAALCATTADGSTLTGSFLPLPPGTNIDLTASGTLDWVHWGLTQATDVNRKSGAPSLIGTLQTTGPDAPAQLGTNQTGFTWTDGTPVLAVTNSTTGILISGLTNGFLLTVGASTERRRLQIYAAARSASGVIQATLSDGSAPGYYDESLGAAGLSNGIFVIDFAAGSAGQQLNVKYFAQSISNSGGYISVQAAALASNVPPIVSLTSPTNNAKFFRLATVPFEASANDIDGAVQRVEYYQATNKIGEAANAPYHFDWENPTPGNYLLTALAVDNDGASSTSAPIAITILSNFPPAVVLTNPPKFSAFIAPTNVLLSATATDIDGFVTKVEFFVGNTKLGESTNSPYLVTWTNPSPGEYFLTARATDNLGASNTSASIDVFVTQLTGFLTVSNATVSGPVDLDAEGPADWAHWGLFTETSYDHKRGVTSLIPNYTVIGKETVYPYADNASTYSWLDGTPTASATNSPTGVYIVGEENGFHIQAPAGLGTNLLKVYLGSFAARGRFLAYLSDFSAPLVTDFAVDNPGNGPATLYTIRYSSAAPGKLLHVRFFGDLLYDDSSGNVTLQAAALETGNRPPQVTITNPPPGTSLMFPANVTITADAFDLDGSVTNVEFFRDGIKFGQTNAPPYSIVWSNPPLGTHLVSARATDNKGLTFMSRDVDFFIGTAGGFLAASGAFPPAQINLSAEGIVDWTHWGLARPSSFDHRFGAGVRISDADRIGNSSVKRYADNFSGYSWTNGTPTPTASASTTGIYIEGLSNGFQVTAPADTNRRRLHIYVGLYGAQARFEASLSDSSARPFVDTSLFNVYGNNYRVYTLDYRASGPGQQLILRQTAAQLFDESFGNVTLQAATLDDLPPPRLFNASFDGSNATFLFTTLLNSNYTIEYSDVLPGSNWIPMIELPGSGVPIQFSDPLPGGSQRFYRVIER